jgi:hypothetical protein
MPNIYLDRPFQQTVRDKMDRMERKADDAYVPEREALFEMLDEEWQRRINQARERSEDY